MTENGLPGQCQDGRGLFGATAIALSADGESAYAVSPRLSSLSILTRDPTDGSPAPISDPSGCFYTLEELFPTCTAMRALGGANDVAISPDGKAVYVAATSDDAIAIFDRDRDTSLLTHPAGTGGCLDEGGDDGCADGRALDEASAVVVSPDGENVYVASKGAQGGIAIFDRDPETGDLTQKAGPSGCIHYTEASGCADGPSQLQGGSNLEISADGGFVYVTSTNRDAVTIYSRDQTDGTLTPMAAPAGCLTDQGIEGCESVTALGEPASLTIGPGGETAYVASERRDAILVFDRDPTSGVLWQKPGTAGCISDTGLSDPLHEGTAGDCQNGVALDGISAVAVLPDGTAAYATTTNSDGVVVLERSPDGELTQRPGTAGCITETGLETPQRPWTEGTCADGRGLRKASGIVVSADSKYAYTAAREGGVGTFDVTEPPTPSISSPPSTVVASDVCGQARERERKARQQLAAVQRSLTRRVWRANHAPDATVKRRTKEAIRKDRLRVKQLRRNKDRAALLTELSCAQS